MMQKIFFGVERLFRPIVVGILGVLAACQPADSPPIEPVDFARMAFTPYSINEGIYPDRTVLQDPNNPFARALPSDLAGPNGEPAVKWNIGMAPVASYYSWATFLARQPNGENQYYVAVSLTSIRQTPQVQGDPDLLNLVTDMAARAFQAMLDNFPGAVTYAADGVTTYDLTLPAVQGILALGKPVRNGWVLVKGPDGQAIGAIQSGH
jgi:hypothetical protein